MRNPLDAALDDFATPRVNVNKNGEVELGEEVSCDGATKKDYHVITHAHADHLSGLSTGSFQIATAATLDLVRAIGKNVRNPLALEYGIPRELKRGRLYLYPATHILGASQVFVETPEGSYAFTGDFKLKGTPVLHPDELVIEATYGRPEDVRDYVNVDVLLLDLVEEGISKGPVDVYASQGKLQEVLSLLSALPRWVKIITDKKSYEVAKVYEKYGIRLPKYYTSTSAEAALEVREKNPYVGLWPLSVERTNKNLSIIVTGWAGKPLVYLKKNVVMVGLSDHADFNELLYYVDESKARWVVADAHRSRSAKTLAKEIEKRLHVRAVAKPRPPPRP